MYNINYDYLTFLQKVNKHLAMTRAIVLDMDPDFFNKVNTRLIDTEIGVPVANCFDGYEQEAISAFFSGTAILPAVYHHAVDELFQVLKDTAKSCFGKNWLDVIYKMTYSSHYGSFRASLAKGPWSLIKHYKEDKWSLFYEDELLCNGSLLDIAEMDVMFNPFQDSLVCLLQGINSYTIMQSIKYVKRALIEWDIYPLLCRGDLFTGANRIEFNDRLYRKRFLLI